MHVDVCWIAPEQMTYGCCTMFNECLAGLDATHHVGFGIDSHKFLPKLRGAIVAFHGGNEEAIGRGPALAAILSAEVAMYEWVIFVNLGDEAGMFPVHLLVHKNMRIWSQTTKPGSPSCEVPDRHMIEGYLPDTRRILDSLDEYERDLDWFFAGQDTHDRRHQCISALKDLRAWQIQSGDSRDSVLVTTTAFGSGLSHETYYQFMKQARVVPCPSGPATPDSFRAAEALEAGAVPILDACSPDGVMGYWDMVFPGHPFIVIEDWSTLPLVITETLKNWDYESRACQFYWKRYKLGMRQWIVKDLISLGAI